MKKSKKIAIALITVCIGLVLGVIGLAGIKFDFSKLNVLAAAPVAYTLEEDFTDIAVSTTGYDVRLLPAEDGVCKVVAPEGKKIAHTVQVQNGTLSIRGKDLRRWYDYVRFFAWESGTIEVYLPKAEYGKLTIRGRTSDVLVSQGFQFEQAVVDVEVGDVKMYASVQNTLSVETDTGDVVIAGASMRQLSASVDTGDILLRNLTVTEKAEIEKDTGDLRISDVTCASLAIETDTGDIYAKNVVASEHVRIETDTGDIELTSCDAATLSLETDTGDIEGTLRTGKDFRVYTSTGDVSVPINSTGGVCSVRTSTGDITIAVEQP